MTEQGAQAAQPAPGEEGKPPPEERGDRPMLAEAPTLEIAGRTYKMRRLGYPDHGRLAAILQAAIRRGKIDLAGVAARGDRQEQTDTLISLLLGAFAYAQPEVLAFLASVLQVDTEALEDAELFPFASLPLVLQRLMEHPDLAAFFGRVGAVLESQPTPTPTSSGPSISSPSDTATPTTTS